MPHSQESFAEADDSPGRKLQHFERGFHSYSMQRPSPKKTDFPETISHRAVGEPSCRWQEFSGRFDQGLQRRVVGSEVLNIGQTLTRHDHVRERAGHRKSPVVYVIVQYDLADVAAFADHAPHPAGTVATYDEVVNLWTLLEGAFQDRHPFRTVAGSGERSPELRFPHYYMFINAG